MKSFLRSILQSKWVVFLLLVAFIMFYVMNVFVPFFNDDIDYMYHPTANGYERYQHFSDVFKDTYISYFFNNGRLLCSFLIILYSGVLGDFLFNIINTVTFVLMILLIGYYSIPKGMEKKLDCWVVILLSFYIFTPGNRTYCLYYWCAGAGTYVVSGLVSIIYLLLVRNLSKRSGLSILKYALLVITGVCFGLEHEMLAFALCGATFLYYAFHRKEITRPLFVFYVAFVVGFLINALSPAILSRGGLDNGSIRLSNMFAFLAKNLLEAKALYLFVLFLVIGKFKGVKLKTFIKENMLVFWALLFSFVPLMFTGQGGRVVFGVEFFSIILMSNLVGQIGVKNRKTQLYRWSFYVSCLFVLYFSVVTYESCKKWTAINQVVDNYFHSPTETQRFDVYTGTALTDYYSIDMANFFGNIGTKTRFGDVKRVDFGSKTSKAIQAIPSLEVEKIIENCGEKLDEKYLIPGDMEVYDYPQLGFLLIQCDSTKLRRVYDHKIGKKRHLSLIPAISQTTKNSHKYMYEIDNPDFKYRYLLLKKSFEMFEYDSIFIAEDKCPPEGIRRIKGV